MALKHKGKVLASSSQASTSPSAPLRGNRAQSQLPYAINKYGIVFIDDEQQTYYDKLVCQKIYEPKYEYWLVAILTFVR